MPAGVQVVTALTGKESIYLDPTGPLWGAVFTNVMAMFGQANNGLTASTTHSIAGGTPLILGWNFISTCANAGDAVTLPVLQPGQFVIVFNAGVAAAGVYPGNSSQNIDGAGAGTAVTLTEPKRCIYYCNATNTITSAQLGLPSA